MCTCACRIVSGCVVSHDNTFWLCVGTFVETMFLKACKLVLASAVLCLSLSPVTAQQQGVAPTGHSIPTTVQPVNGSQVNVGCTGTQPNPLACLNLDPATAGGNTSFLVDGNIPAPLDFSDTNWARELMTVNHNGGDFEIRINFNSANAARMELVLFNCPDLGIGAMDITVETGPSSQLEVLGNFTLQNTSCDSLLTVCIPLIARVDPVLTYRINFLTGTNPDIDWTHIAEVTFYEDSVECADPFPDTPASTEPTGAAPTVVASGMSTAVAPVTTPPPGSTTPSGMEPNTNGTGMRNTIIIAVVVVVIAVALVMLVLIAVLCIFLTMRRRIHGTAEVEKLRKVLKEHESIGLNTIKPPQIETDPTHEYDVVPDKSRHTWSGGKSNKVTSSELAPVYSTVAESKSDTHSPKRDEMYATIREDEYAVVDKLARPAVPKMSEDLKVYLAPKLLSSSDTMQSENRQLAQLSKPISGELSSNPLYDSAGTRASGNAPLQKGATPAAYRINTEPDNPLRHMRMLESDSGSAETGHVYAVLEESMDTQQAIYEEVYSEPLKPSLFMQKQASSEAAKEELQPYAPIYTVPTAPVETELIEITKKHFKLHRELGDGYFGKVFLAKTVGLSAKELKLGNSEDKKNASFLVAVKMLKPSASKANCEAFEKEYKFMSRLNHANVIRILAVCTSGDTPFIMMEYMEKGDLNQYLQQYTEIVDSAASLSDGQILASTLQSMCIQIASAMQYLAARNFVHRDLATRNCLVSDNNVVKIADFGMSRHLYESHYYAIRGHAILPVRWMATECFYGLFSAKTDVWAFGVTMWEIYTLTKDEPYEGITDQEIVQDAIKGEERTILEKPEACPQAVYDVMLSCWAYNATDRATFKDAFVSLSAVN